MRALLVLPLLSLGGCTTSTDAACEAPGTQVAVARSAGCLTIDEDRLLLVRTSDGWAIPGGSVESGESSDVAAVRETLEESGVGVVAGPAACAVPSKGFVAHVCVATGDTTPHPDGLEVSEARWFDADALRALPARDLRYPGQVAAYLAAIEGAVNARKALQSGAPAPTPPE